MTNRYSQPDRELAELEQKVASDPDGHKHLADLADAYADRGRWQDAIRAYEKAVALDPENAILYNDLAIAYEEVGDHPHAEKNYRNALVLEPRLATTHLNLGLLYKEQANVKEAILHLEQCLELSDDSYEIEESRVALNELRAAPMSPSLVGPRLPGFAHNEVWLSNMREYRLTAEFFSQLRRRSIIQGAGMLAGVCLLVIFVGLLRFGRLSPGIPGILVFVAVIMLATIIFNLRKHRRFWLSYRLFVDDNAILRRQEGLAEVAIGKSEVSKITGVEGKGLGKGIIVHAGAPSRQIIIPSMLQDFLEVQSHLSNWQAIEFESAARTRWATFIGLVLGLLLLATFLLPVITQNPLALIGGQLIWFVSMLAILVSFQRSPILPASWKRFSWLLILILIATAVNIVRMIINL